MSESESEGFSALLDAYRDASMRAMDSVAAVRMWETLHPGRTFPLEDTRGVCHERMEAARAEILKAWSEREAVTERWIAACEKAATERDALLAMPGTVGRFIKSAADANAALESERQETARLRLRAADADRLQAELARVGGALSLAQTETARLLEDARNESKATVALAASRLRAEMEETARLRAEVERLRSGGREAFAVLLEEYRAGVLDAHVTDLIEAHNREGAAFESLMALWGDA